MGVMSYAQSKRILVFNKTAGFHHNSIKEGSQFLMDWGKKQNVFVDTTTNADNFNEDNLKRYNLIVFLNTTGDVLNPVQQIYFERFIQAGGGYVGIHAASDTEYDWEWYNHLMGGFFNGHPGNPNVQKGKMIVMDKTHISTAHLPETFDKTDEFYRRAKHSFQRSGRCCDAVFSPHERKQTAGKISSDCRGLHRTSRCHAEIQTDDRQLRISRKSLRTGRDRS